MTKRQVPSIPLTSIPKHDISINNFKSGNNSNKLNRMGHSMFSTLRFETDRKKYVPLGALSFDNSQISNNIISLQTRNRQSTGVNSNKFNPLTIPFIPTSQIPMLLPKPVSLSHKKDIIITNSTFPNKQKLFTEPAYKSIPLSSKLIDTFNTNSIIRNKRMMSRNLVRIRPQNLKTVYNVKRNSTTYTSKPYIANIQLKNWPNEALQNIQDLLNYEKYTSFPNEEFEVPVVKSNVSSKHKSPEIQYPLHLPKIPAIDFLSEPNDHIDSMIRIDSLLDDLRNNNINAQNYGSVSDVTQNTVFHILNLKSEKANVTLTSPIHIKNINQTKTGTNRPPQNVHIMFMVDKDESLRNDNSSGQYVPKQEIFGDNTGCPTIMINSITQINNTIESKEGCTDLNIIINSHVLNTNIFQPIADDIAAPLNSNQDIVKNSYPETTEHYQNNYNYDYKYPTNQIETDKVDSADFNDPEHEIPTFQLFQGTQINVVQADENIQDTLNTLNDESSLDNSEPNELIDTNAVGSSLSNGIDNNNEDTDINSGSEVSQFSETAPIINDVGTGQANDAIGTISLPSLPNLSIRPGQIINGISSLGSGGNTGILGSSGETNLSPTDSITADDDDDELLDALSPVGLLESISSVFTYLTVLNPINYGIFSVAVAPFIAFAAGILGVAAFLFPWAFPSNLDFSRAWNDKSGKINIRFNTNLRDIVESSIYKYMQLNEWKGRRRKKKRRR
jgi:hypothetical protein